MEAKHYLQQPDNADYLDELHARHRQHVVQQERVTELATRALLLDEEGIATMVDMVNYVLKQRKLSTWAERNQVEAASCSPRGATAKPDAFLTNC